MLTVNIVNRTPGKEYAQYKYETLINGKTIAKGTIKHNRNDPWWILLFRIYQSAAGSAETEKK